MDKSDDTRANSDYERLASLLLRWEEAWEQGRDISPKELCAEYPHLAEELSRRIEVLRGFAPLAPDGGGTVGRPGRVVGPYTLAEMIGEGGMGEVWLARQAQPVKRKVAVKFLRAGPSSRDALARFEQERQALAVLDHPNIAKVYDGGLAEDGAPYFVMEFVPGLPLLKFCDQAQLPVRERLELFQAVCQAVQHAHQKGIIHRDLKPANILVTLVDGVPTPKIIDFGVAKTISGKIAELTLSTHFGAMVGTLEYMAPEQAGLTAQDVDTRADIYSLGVILYELLTGLRPFDEKRLKKAALDEAVRILKEEDPPSLQSRLSTSDVLPTAAAVRRIEPGKLLALVRGELDWIVRKCLNKDHNRRYESAGGLARDVQRYLRDEPVEARPQSAGYRVWKFCRRHRAGAAAAAVVAMALLAGFAAALWGLFEARAGRVLAEAARGNEREARDRAEQAARREQRAREQADRRLSQLANINDILGSLFDQLDPAAAASTGKPLAALIGERLDRAASLVDGESVGDPLAVARLQVRLANALTALGYPHRAANVLDKAQKALASLSEQDDEDSNLCRNSLAYSYLEAGRSAEAVLLLQSVLKWCRQRYGADDDRTLRALRGLAWGLREQGKAPLAIPLAEEAYRFSEAKFGDVHKETLACMNALALSYFAGGQKDQAGALLEKSSRLIKDRLGPDHPEAAKELQNLSQVLLSLGQVDRALPLCTDALSVFQSRLGLDHPATLSCRGAVAECHRAAGRVRKALTEYAEAVRVAKEKLGEAHPLTLSLMNNLAVTHGDAGEYKTSIPLLESVVRARRRELGDGHPDLLASLANLARAHEKLGQTDLAVPLLEEVVSAGKGTYPAGSLALIQCTRSLASLYVGQNRFEAAIPLYETLCRHIAATAGPDDAQLWFMQGCLAECYRSSGQLAPASAAYHQLAERLEKVCFEHPFAQPTMENLLGCLEKEGRFKEAEAWLEKWAAALWKRGRPGALLYADTLYRLAGIRARLGKVGEAEKELRECLAIQQKEAPELWPTYEFMSFLGEVLLARHQYVEAEKLLLAGYGGLKRNVDKVPGKVPLSQALSQAVKRLVNYYTEVGRPEELKTWQEVQDGLRNSKKPLPTK